MTSRMMPKVAMNTDEQERQYYYLMISRQADPSQVNMLLSFIPSRLHRRRNTADYGWWLDM